MKKIKSLCLIVFVSLSFTIVPPLNAVYAKQTFLNILIANTRMNLKHWGGGAGGGGGGGGGGGIYFPKILHSIDADTTDSEQGDSQIQLTEDSFESEGYLVTYSFAQSKTNFLDLLEYSNSLTTERLSVNFVGTGETISVNGMETPALIMRDSATITFQDIYAIQGTQPTWRLHVVMLQSCYSMYNSDLANEFHNLGAKVVLGFDDEVQMDLALTIIQTFWDHLNSENLSVEQAYYQTEDDFEEAESFAVWLSDYLAENELIAAALTLFSSTGLEALIWFLIPILLIVNPILAVLLMALAFVGVLAVCLGILYIIYAVTEIPNPFTMVDFNGGTETYL